MATATSEEIQESWEEDTEYQTMDDNLPEAYTEAVEEGNASDDDDDNDE